MKPDLLRQTLIEIMAAVFKVEPDVISGETSPATFANWDSLRHLDLAVALEEEFDVTISEEELIEMMNLDAILAIVTKKIG